ncbi:MAG: metal-sulfur cluster biosynthetic enzyme [Candidatus Zixiibacteriota bacterium]|nr:MAG: metal-sulfur cluster biosynthetic enzyme [candidate division Zixibacteria bacterium]
MAKEISEENVQSAIAQVKHPAIDRTLVDLKIVKEISVNDNKVSVIMAFPFPNIPIGDMLVNSIKEPIEKLGAEVEVEITKMTEEELEGFLAMEKESWKGDI